MVPIICVKLSASTLLTALVGSFQIHMQFRVEIILDQLQFIGLYFLSYKQIKKDQCYFYGFRKAQVAVQMEERLLNNYKLFQSKMEYSEEFQPDECSQAHQQQYRPPKKAVKYVSGAKNGVWSQLQHTKYIVFMEHNKEKMRSKEKRRTNKLYKAMAKYIQTRNALQCRSHHQKLEQKFVYPNKIITNFKSHHDLTLYFELKQKLQTEQRASASTQTYELKLQDEDRQTYLPIQVNPTQPIQHVSSHSYPSSSNPEIAQSINIGNPQVPYASWQYPVGQQCPPYYFYQCFTIY